jgi:hypothetical protein
VRAAHAAHVTGERCAVTWCLWESPVPIVVEMVKSASLDVANRNNGGPMDCQRIPSPIKVQMHRLGPSGTTLRENVTAGLSSRCVFPVV